MAIWDVGLLAGQSNASGTPGAYQNPPSPATTAGMCWDYRDSGTTFVQISEPASTSGIYAANNGSCIPSFVNTFTARSERPIAIVRSARGGTALLAANDSGALGNGHWDTGGACFPNSVTRLLDAISKITAMGHTIGNVFVIWSQGGRDAQAGNDLELYEAANAALVSRWRTATGIPTLQMFMEELSSVQGGEGALADEIAQIRTAQNNACASTDGLHMAFNEGKDYVNRPGWMRAIDGIHYMQVGLNYMGTKMGTYAADHYEFGIPVDPPDVPSAERIRTSILAHRLRMTTPPPPPPPLPVEWMEAGTYEWLCPASVTAVKVEVWGAGGSGRGGVALGRGGMSGATGQYRVITSHPVTPGVTYTIVVGAGGNGGTYNTNDGTAGGNSNFGSGTIISIGGPKPAAAASIAPAPTGGTGGTLTAGIAGNASANSSGSDGAAGPSAPGSGGAGGAGGITGNILGKPGTAPGGAGGGGKGNTAGAHGGNGGSGGIRISEAV